MFGYGGSNSSRRYITEYLFIGHASVNRGLFVVYVLILYNLLVVPYRLLHFEIMHPQQMSDLRGSELSNEIDIPVLTMTSFRKFVIQYIHQ